MKKLTMIILLSCSMFWSTANAEPAIDCGGREAIKLVSELAAENDYGMMIQNASTKYFDTHPTQEFIDKRNYAMKAEITWKAASQTVHDADARWHATPGAGWGRKGEDNTLWNAVGAATNVSEAARLEWVKARGAAVQALQNGIAVYQAQAKMQMTYKVETIRTLAKHETGRRFCQATLRGSAGEFGEETAPITYTVEVTSDGRLYIEIQRSLN
jgi:hypothetical protein